MLAFGRLITAVVTPFQADESIDFDSFRRLVDGLIGAGNDALVITGTTGESPVLTHDERMALYREALDAAGGRARIIAGTGGYNTAESIRWSREAAELGVDGLLQVTPYYNKPPQDGLYEHFAAIAAVLARTGDTNGARVALLGALASASAMEDDVRHNEAIILGIGRRLDAIERSPGARAILAAAAAAVGGREEGFHRDLTLEMIATAQAGAGDFAGALKTTDAITRADFYVDALLAVAEKRIERGETAAARDLLDDALAEAWYWDEFDFLVKLTLYEYFRDAARCRRRGGRAKNASRDRAARGHRRRGARARRRLYLDRRPTCREGVFMSHFGEITTPCNPSTNPLFPAEG